MNLIVANRDSLKANHYVRKADPKQSYWFDFSERKLLEYEVTHGENFALIIFGDKDDEADYYALPYAEVSDIFCDTFLSVNGDRRRWIGNIEDGKMRVSHYPDRIDITRFRGVSIDDLPSLVASASKSGGQATKHRDARQGFGLTSKERRAVELRAMKVVEEYLRQEWSTVEDVSSTESCDFVCKEGDNTLLYVEVKGSTGDAAKVIVTRNEVRLAREEAPNTLLAIVSEIILDQSAPPKASGGGLTLISNWNPQEESLEAISYEFTLPSSNH